MDDARRTVFVTGSSSGIGLATAAYFLEQGWDVVATMRDPDGRDTPLHGGRADLVHLDVTDQSSIDAAVQHAVDAHGSVDVLVNNAGYALSGPFEGTTTSQVSRQFDTNVYGLMQVTRGFLPVFRRQGEGLVVNVTSTGGRIGYPLYSVYNASKWAVEGFSESLRYELRACGVRVKVIEPGAIETDFYGRSNDPAECGALDGAYDEIIGRSREGAARGAIEPGVVARAIFRAATDGSRRLRYPVGVDAWQAAILRRLVPERVFFWVLERVVLD
jgi:NAD(P)-dependent dehydrogenase (short-subunit alcohol dehydrogenase family)